MTDALQLPYYADRLRRELAQRSSDNPRYSLRAFARALGLSASTLSRAIAGKRPLPLSAAPRVVSALVLTPREAACFYTSLATPGAELSPAPTGAVHDLEEETFRVVADWYHYAILELTYTEGFEPNATWIARRLGIPVIQAQVSMDRLVRVGLLKLEGGRASKTHKTLWTRCQGRTMSSAAILRHHQQCLDLAKAALNEIPASERISTVMTIPIHRDKLPVARKMIEEFSLELCRAVATPPMRDVYQLSISFHSILRRAPK